MISFYPEHFVYNSRTLRILFKASAQADSHVIWVFRFSGQVLTFWGYDYKGNVGFRDHTACFCAACFARCHSALLVPRVHIISLVPSGTPAGVVDVGLGSTMFFIAQGLGASCSPFAGATIGV